MERNLKFLIFLCLSIVPFLAWVVADGALFDFIQTNSSGLFFPFITGKNFAFRLVIEIALVAWVFLAANHPEYRPKKSLLLLSYTAFIAVILIADIFGVDPARSIFSNFERMEGFVTHIHLYVYFVILISMLKTEVSWHKIWKMFIASNVVVLIWGYLQLIGSSKFFLANYFPELASKISAKFPIHMSEVRLDSTLGNSAYFAIYTAIFAFLSVFFYFRAEARNQKILFGLLTFFNLVALYYTSTRGTLLAIVAGVFVALCTYIFNVRKNKYTFATILLLPLLGIIAVFLNTGLVLYFFQSVAAYLLLVSGLAIKVALEEKNKQKKIASFILLTVALLTLVFSQIKDTNLIKSSLALSRLANISPTEITTFSRFTIWKMSYEGWKDRPILGYGQDNFGYVFARYYDPQMYNQEPWFDRSHNVFFDWLIAGGILGLLAYLSLFAAAVYLVLFRNNSFSKVEQALLLGILATYFIHNVFVFDNLVSYILFFTILAYIASRTTDSHHENKHSLFYESILPGIGVVLAILLFWYSFYKPYTANQLLIKAIDVNRLLSVNPIDKVLEIQAETFKKALALGRWGAPEVEEQLIQTAVKGTTYAPQITTSDEKRVYTAALSKLLVVARDQVVLSDRYYAEDVRMLYLKGFYYKAIGELAKAETYYLKAHQLSPMKQQISFELISTYLQAGKSNQGYELAKQTYLSAPDFVSAQVVFAVSSIYAKKEDEARKILEGNGHQFPGAIPEVINAYLNIKNYAKALALLQEFKRQNPGEAANVDALIKQIESER